MNHSTHHVMMIRPTCFRMNEETATNNYYQRVLSHLTPDGLQSEALKEFDVFVSKLRSHGIQVTVIEDMKDSDTPDSIFPNNWISFHDDGLVGIYSIFAKNRRREKRMDIPDILSKDGFSLRRLMDYSEYEEKAQFLEGTGSMVLDRRNKKAYAALSPRTEIRLLNKFCRDFGFQPVVFHAYQTVGEDVKRLPIYHTNVMMSVAEDFAVICLDSIDDYLERKLVLEELKGDGKEIIEINEFQVGRFAGNMLQVQNMEGKKYLVMSSVARKSLQAHQVVAIEKFCSIICSDLNTIETCGGGSARCMMAEVFHSHP